MKWAYLITAVLLEVCGTTSMKLSKGLTIAAPTFFIFVFYGMSLLFLTLALKNIEISVAYAVWSGLGTTLITALGIVYFKESLSIQKILYILFITAGVVGLYISDREIVKF